MLDELLMSGHMQESSKKTILKAVAGQESLIEEDLDEDKKK